ncbi:MAG: GTP-binding protein [Nitrososphaerota archaeon]|nr:GTP-binding protein [Nitrososphaerota archaeon]
MNYNYAFKVVVLGDVAVGKTSLITRFSKRTHRVEYDPTTESEITFVKLQATNVDITLKIYDTVGGVQDPGHFSEIASGANGFILVYEVDRDSSYNNLDRYYEQILPYVNAGTVLVLVGNKVDIKSRRIPSTEAMEKAARLKMAYFETSAKVGSNIDTVFSHILKELIKRRITDLGRKLEGLKEKDLNESFRIAMEEVKDDPFEATIKALRNLSIDVEYPAAVTGKSGIKHEFSIALHGSTYTVVDILVQPKAIGSQSVLAFIAKCNDTEPSRKILVCVPKLEDEAKKLAVANKIETIESFSLQDAAVKLFYMLNEQEKVLPADAMKEEMQRLTDLIGQMVNH